MAHGTASSLRRASYYRMFFSFCETQRVPSILRMSRIPRACLTLIYRQPMARITAASLFASCKHDLACCSLCRVPVLSWSRLVLAGCRFRWSPTVGALLYSLVPIPASSGRVYIHSVRKIIFANRASRGQCVSHAFIPMSTSYFPCYTKFECVCPSCSCLSNVTTYMIRQVVPVWVNQRAGQRCHRDALASVIIAVVLFFHLRHSSSVMVNSWKFSLPFVYIPDYVL